MFTEDYGFEKITNDNGEIIYINPDLRCQLTTDDIYRFIELCEDGGYEFAVTVFNDQFV